MEVALPLDQMTVVEKLRAIETIWEDLSRNPGDIPVPEWHWTELEKRLASLAAGEEEVMELEEAKRRIADAIR